MTDHSKRKKTPDLVALDRGSVYCQLCKQTITAGQLVAWWRIRHPRRGLTWTAYCPTCHYASLRRGRPLR